MLISCYRNALLTVKVSRKMKVFAKSRSALDIFRVYWPQFWIIHVFNVKLKACRGFTWLNRFNKLKMWIIYVGPKTYLFFHVLKWCRADDWKANQEYIGLRIWQWPETVIIFLTGCIKKTQSVRISSNHNSDRIVVEYL